MSLLAKSNRRGNIKKMNSKSFEVEFTAKDLPSLRRKRTITFKKLNKTLEIGILAANNDSQRDLFFAYHQDVKQLASTFENTQCAILDVSEEQESDVVDMQERFDEIYYRIQSIYRSLTKSELIPSSSTLSNQHRDNLSNIRLPKITLPSFSGDIRQFPEYFDTFNALIHNSSSITDTEKFHYLISSLSGDALSVVRAFPRTHEHYNDAYEALAARYKSKRALAFTCWRDLLNVELKIGNAREFQTSLDNFEENLSILKTMQLPVAQWDFVLVYHILSKLDGDLRRSFEENYSDTEMPSYEQLLRFLRSKCQALLRDTHFTELIGTGSGSPVVTTRSAPTTTARGQSKRFNTSQALVAATTQLNITNENKSESFCIKCTYCNGPHSISSCTDFLKKSVDERLTIASDRNWCYNCLKASHQLKGCKSVFSCRTCHRKHHTLLHRESNQIVSSLVSGSQSGTTVLLATAVVQVRDSSGRMQTFRALFDTGSQSNFITESAVKSLSLTPTTASTSVSGLGDAAAPIVGDVKCSLGTNGQVLFELDLHVISKICGDQPIAKLNTSGWSHIKSLPLADPGFDIPGPIDLLLAADIFAESVLNEHIKGNYNQPTAFNSVFGWLLLGKTALSSSTLLHCALPDGDSELDSLVHRFWELDSLPASSPLTPEEMLCERKFIETRFRDESGRYIVYIPFKDEEEPTFEGSRDVALRRFHATERRLSRDTSLRIQYTAFMSDYIESNHMSLVPVDEVGKGKYYIPHHPVLNPESVTTQLRVVFDASAKDLNCRSLNDAQLIGPKLQPNILDILLRFREHNVVFMADARQMFRQILISPHHRDYQRVFWRRSPDDLLQEYRLNTVTYGLASSPYLACRTMRQLAEDEGDSYPLAKQIILTDVYVDDVCTGFKTLELAQQAKSQIVALLGRGCFQLRKWASNEPGLLSDLPQEDCRTGSVSLDNCETPALKVLGLKWDPSSDTFLFEIKPLERPCTKRSILSEVARIFDPLGFLSPISIQAKCLIQKLWILGVGWDQTPPEGIVKAWDAYRHQLSLLCQLRIPRKLTCSNAVSYQLHGFCDSSEAAYGAVIYVRIEDEQGQIHTFLVCSKARVVPLKRISLPRLELCAAVLLSDLYKLVRDFYLPQIKFDAVFLWSDSTVVLSWLRAHSSRWATFVANRVSHIQDILPTDCWHHVSSGDNPADVCSRGQLPGELLNNTLWWAGPSWLLADRESWPADSTEMSHEDDMIVQAEARKSVTLTVNTVSDIPNGEPTPFDTLLTQFSSLQKIVRVLTYVNRFIANCPNRNQSIGNRDGSCHLYTSINNVERHNSLMQLVKHVQSITFSEQISNLKSNKSLSKPFRKLNPFIDDRGVLRVGGRISRSGLEYEHKHPAFLHSDHQLTYLIIDFIHRNYLHPGINTTHFLLLQQFWIISAKRTIRRRLSKCLHCFRLNPQLLQPFMSEMPSYRVNQIKPFSVIGVDFGGPFRIKLGLHRGAKIDKAYLCLFVCLATKAVHLEVVSTLSTDGFIAALRRFVARRGRCNVIHADCGTNFVGARNQLASLMQEASSAEKIEFKFNPPSAPHFGGVWEIQIKAAKSHLLRVVGDQVLTFEELTTLFAQIEAVLNSRPLCPISSDPNDLSALTPGHFLTLEPLTAVPDEDLSNINVKRLHRWQLLQSFQQNFWSRWKNEYLNSLTQRAKWTKDSKPLQIGSMVVIKDDVRSPLYWPLARVVDLLPGADGIVRIAVVKVANGHTIQRPLVKLCPLPIED